MLQKRLGLSRSETNLALDIIHSSLHCLDSLTFSSLLEQVKTIVPFSYARCGFGNCSEFESKKMEAFQFITGFPDEWEARYAEKNYFLNDNVAHTAFLKQGLIFWPDYIHLPGVGKERNDKSARIMDEAASMGLKDGWLCSLHGRLSTEAAIISLAGKNLKKTERSKNILKHLLPHLCQAVKRIVSDHSRNPSSLTPREAEILTWTAAGKTAWEISIILNISRRTVEFHMGNILNKLDAVNACQAVAVGLTSGLIKY